MDPQSLAAAAVGLLASFFGQAGGALAERSGELVAESGLTRLKALYEWVRSKLIPGSYQGALLDGVQAEPDNADRQEILKAELARLIDQDQEFAAGLERLVAEVERAGGVRLTAVDTGVVAGRDVLQHGHYVAGRDMTVIGKGPRKEKPTGKIRAPTDRQHVSRSFTAKGTLSGIPQDRFVWLAVQVNDLLWPKQQISPAQDGSWVREVYEGGTTKRFSLVLLMIGDEGQNQIEQWIHHGESTSDWPGLENIPDASQLDVVVDLALA
jgi:hypothetical protein